MAKTKIISFLLSLLIQIHLCKPSIAINFACASFPCQELLLAGAARIDSGAILLTNSTAEFAIGRALFPSPVPFRPAAPNSTRILPFLTEFVFSITPSSDKQILPGHGMAFAVFPAVGIGSAAAAGHLGLTSSVTDGNPDNHLFAIELDVFRNPELKDIDYNHVGVDLNSVKSLVAAEAGYWDGNDGNEGFVKLKMNSGERHTVWIEYDSAGRLTVTMAPVPLARPRRPLIAINVDLSEVFLDKMNVGFSAATGNLMERHEVHSWSFTAAAGSKVADGTQMIRE